MAYSPVGHSRKAVSFPLLVTLRVTVEVTVEFLYFISFSGVVTKNFPYHHKNQKNFSDLLPKEETFFRHFHAKCISIRHFGCNAWHVWIVNRHLYRHLNRHPSPIPHQSCIGSGLVVLYPKDQEFISLMTTYNNTYIHRKMFSQSDYAYWSYAECLR